MARIGSKSFLRWTGNIHERTHQAQSVFSCLLYGNVFTLVLKDIYRSVHFMVCGIPDTIADKLK